MTTTNGLPRDARGAALYYRTHGRAPVPIPFKSKRPAIEDWPSFELDDAALDRHFPAGTVCNLGLKLGQPSGGLLDVDLDSDEAVRAAPHVPPPTEWISGHTGRPQSHYWYTVENPPHKASEVFADADSFWGGTPPGFNRNMLLELRSTGAQTLVYPSVDESDQPYLWHKFAEPARVELATLRTAVRKLAACALRARHWPEKGSRHRARMALAGALTKAGWEPDLVAAFGKTVALAAEDDDLRDAERLGEDSAERLEEGGTLYGWPALEQTLKGNGAAVCRQVREWLGLGAPSKATAKIRKIPPWVPFPMECLPEPLRNWALQCAAAIGCDPVIAALPALCAAASAIGNTRTLRLNTRGPSRPSCGRPSWHPAGTCRARPARRPSVI